MMLPTTRLWLSQWPGPSASEELVLSWLESTPGGLQLEGPEQEWALRQGGLWLVDEYRTSRSPTRVGSFTSQGLYDYWAHKGLGLVCLRPSITTADLHTLLTTAPTEEQPGLSGELQLGVACNPSMGVVSLHFGQPLSWIGFDPHTADQLANKLTEFAALIRRKAH